MAFLIAAFLFLAADEPPPLPESPHSTIGYPNVAAAMDALLANREAALRVESGWTIFEEEVQGSGVIWTFTPENHPAHPAVVRRALVEKGGALVIEMAVHCEAAKAPCDQLVRDFQNLNQRLVAATDERRKNAPAANPRDAEMRDLAIQWLDMQEQGKADESYALLADNFKEHMTLDAWRALVKEQRQTLGALRKRSVRRTVWYVNPPNAPMRGTYVVVEFDSVYDKAESHFCYVVLHSQNDAPFRVMRVETMHKANPFG